MRIDECINAYVSLAAGIFEKRTTSKIPGFEIIRAVAGMEKYRAKVLEDKICEILRKYMSEEQKLASQEKSEAEIKFLLPKELEHTRSKV
jgi:hypothetical protein